MWFSHIHLCCRFLISFNSRPAIGGMSTAEMDQLTSGASNRIIPILKTLRTFIIFIQSFILAFVLLLLPRRRSATGAPQSPSKSWKRRLVWRLEEEDTLRRRALAEDLYMGFESDDGNVHCRWNSYLFFGVRRNALFCRSWLPVTGELKLVFFFISFWLWMVVLTLNS